MYQVWQVQNKKKYYICMSRHPMKQHLITLNLNIHNMYNCLIDILPTYVIACIAYVTRWDDIYRKINIFSYESNKYYMISFMYTYTNIYIWKIVIQVTWMFGSYWHWFKLFHVYYPMRWILHEMNITMIYLWDEYHNDLPSMKPSCLL